MERTGSRHLRNASCLLSAIKSEHGWNVVLKKSLINRQEGTGSCKDDQEAKCLKVVEGVPAEPNCSQLWGTKSVDEF